MKHSLFVVLSALAGCGGAAVDHERLGDGHYRAGRYQEAVAEYRTAQRTAPVAAVWGKLGAAALHAGDYATAVEAYQGLGLADQTRQQEAARGLERVLRAVARGGIHAGTLRSSAIVALRRIAPDRPLARPALDPGTLTELGRAEAVSVLPSAISSADRGGEVDRLLVDYGRALEETTACDAATEAYRTVLRRAANSRLQAQARAGLGACALRLGLDALASDQAATAEEWLTTAVTVDTTGPISYRARIGLGEARLRQGDVLGAAVWWQSILSAAGVPDSLRQLAAGRLNSLAAAGPPESGAR